MAGISVHATTFAFFGFIGGRFFITTAFPFTTLAFTAFAFFGFIGSGCGFFVTTAFSFATLAFTTFTFFGFISGGFWICRLLRPGIRSGALLITRSQFSGLERLRLCRNTGTG
jgi:hypothetical protein